MSLTPAQLRAQFSWEAACQGLRSAFPSTSPPSPAETNELRKRLVRVRDSYVELCEAFDVVPIDMAPSPPTVRQLQRQGRSLRTHWRRIKDWLGVD